MRRRGSSIAFARRAEELRSRALSGPAIAEMTSQSFRPGARLCLFVHAREGARPGRDEFGSKSLISTGWSRRQSGRGGGKEAWLRGRSAEVGAPWRPGSAGRACPMAVNALRRNSVEEFGNREQARALSTSIIDVAGERRRDR